MASKIPVLIVDGICMADFYYKNLTCKADWSAFEIKHVTVGYDRSKGGYNCPDSKRELLSGRYKVVVVCDLSNHPKAHNWLMRDLGTDLQSFVKNGGCVAFPTSEGFLLQETLQKLFGTTWVKSDYYRTTWGACGTSSTLANFPGINPLLKFSAKCATLRNVSSEERVFGVTESSTYESMLSTSLFGDKTPAPTSNNFDVSVAVHNYGKGRIAYFGDVNGEKETAELVAAFCRGAHQSPKPSPVVADATLPCETLKNEGNAHFATSRYKEALKCYDAALFGSAAITSNQGSFKSQIWANKAAAYLKLKKFPEAESSARSAIEFDKSNDKARFRLAKALEEQGGKDRLVSALAELSDMKEKSSPEIVALDIALREKIKGLGEQNAKNIVEQLIPPLDSCSWAEGLENPYEWLVDCYRMRVDDDYVWGSGFLHGLYEPDKTAMTVFRDFIVFTKLAVENEVIPDDWDWKRFMDVAKNLLPYGFEKSDAQDKYGSENVFSVVTGGRSLRYTGEIVYGFSASQCDDNMDDFEEIYGEVERATTQKFLIPGNQYFDDIGGVSLWKNLLTSLKRSI